MKRVSDRPRNCARNWLAKESMSMCRATCSIETCRIIMGEGANMITTPLLRERDWGGFTGRYIPELKDEVWPDDIETLDALKKRAQCFLNFIRESYPESKVLAVGHGIINKAIQSVYFDKPMNEVPRMMNAEVRVLML